MERHKLLKIFSKNTSNIPGRTKYYKNRSNFPGMPLKRMLRNTDQEKVAFSQAKEHYEKLLRNIRKDSSDFPGEPFLNFYKNIYDFPGEHTLRTVILNNFLVGCFRRITFRKTKQNYSPIIILGAVQDKKNKKSRPTISRIDFKNVKRNSLGIFRCPLCEEQIFFRTEYELRIHAGNFHGNEKLLGSGDQSITTGNESLLEDVVEDKETISSSVEESNLVNSGENRSEIEMLPCPLCKERMFFRTNEQLSMHTKNFHKSERLLGSEDQSITTNRESIGEDVTQANTTSCFDKNHLVKSVRKKSSKKIPRKSRKSRRKISGLAFTKTNSTSNLLLCSLCEAKTYFVTQSKLVAHIQNFHQNIDEENQSVSTKTAKTLTLVYLTGTKSAGKEADSLTISGSIEDLRERLKQAQLEGVRYSLEKQGLEEDLANLKKAIRSGSSSHIGSILKREIDDLESCKNEQMKLVATIQNSIDVHETSQTSIVAQKLSEDQAREDSNMKVSRWLTHDQPNESKSVDVQVGPITTEKSMQTSQDWVQQQEAKERLLADLAKEKDSLVTLLQEKSGSIHCLQTELIEMKRTESHATSELENTLAMLKQENRLQQECQMNESRKAMNTMRIEKEEISKKLEDRNRRIKDFKQEIECLQKVYNDVRKDSKEEKYNCDQKLDEFREELHKKTMIIDELQDKLRDSNDDAENIKGVCQSLERRKDQLVLEITKLISSLDKCKYEKEDLASKLSQSKSIIREKTKSFDEKIDDFLKNEKKLNIALKEAKTNLDKKETIVQQKENKVSMLTHQVKENEALKLRYETKIEELTEELRKEDHSRTIISEKFIALEKKCQSVSQEKFKLEERSKTDYKLKCAESEAIYREQEKLREDYFTLRQQHDSVSREHELCAKRKHEMERQFQYKETQLRNEMEGVLKETTTEYQLQVEHLKVELRNISGAQANRINLEDKVKRLEQENKDLSVQFDEVTRSEIDGKRKFTDEVIKLESMVAATTQEKESLTLQLSYLKSEVEACKKESKAKSDEIQKEAQYYKAEITSVRKSLHDQLLITKKLQEEKQDGGLPWQNEKRDMLNELDSFKDRERDSEIERILLQEKYSKLTRDAQHKFEKRDQETKKLHQLLEDEKRNVQMIQEECTKKIEKQVQKHIETSRQSEEYQKRIGSLEMEHDLKMVKLETSERFSREENDKLREKHNNAVTQKEKLQRENRAMVLKISKLEDENCRFKREAVDHSEEVRKIEERLQDVELVKSKLKTATTQQEAKIQSLENDTRRLKIESANSQIAESVQEENSKLKDEHATIKQELEVCKDNLRMLEKEKKLLSKQNRFSEEQQSKLQQQNESLQFKLQELTETTQDQLSTAHEKLSRTKYNHQSDIHEKNERISVLNEQIRNLQRSFANLKTKHNSVEIKSMQETQREMDKMGVVHENEVKMKSVTIDMLKKEVVELKDRILELSNASAGKYKKELASIMESNALQVQGLEDENTSLKTNIGQLKTTLKNLETSTVGHEEVDKLVANHVADLRSRDQAVISLNQKLDGLSLAMKENTEDKIKMNVLLANQKMEMRSRDQEIESLKRNLEGLNEIILVKDEESDKISANNKVELQSRDEIISSLNNRIKKLNVEINDCAAIEKKMTIMSANQREEMESRDQIVSLLKTQLSQLKESTDSGMSKLQKKLSERETELQSLNIRLSSDSEIAKNFAKENSCLISQTEKLNAECNAYQNQIKDLIIKHEATEKKLNDVRDEGVVLIKEKKELTNELHQLTDKLECEQNNRRTEKASKIEVRIPIIYIKHYKILKLNNYYKHFSY